jgi:sulfide:quinone oxidoreductase
MPARQPRMLIAGGGVGALEAALALRELLGPTAAIELVTPADELEYRPLAVAEPFGFAPAQRLPFSRLEQTHAVHHRRELMERVDPAGRCAQCSASGWQEYDALVVAVGARRRAWLDGALTFGGGPDVAAYAELLEEARCGPVQQIVFAAPPPGAWPLPLYELALLTAGWRAERGVSSLELHLVLPEAEPLEAFGPAASRAVRDVLVDRGVRIHRGRRVERVAGGRAWLDDGGWLEADRVVTLPHLVGNAPPGLPADVDAFLPVGGDGAVIGASGVWAVGDATDRPIRHGGLAAQQADVAAAAIARRLGVPAPAPDPAPVLRGVLLTGVASMYLRGSVGHSEVAFNPLWSPPVKVAGRYLAPYLAGEAALLATPVLGERAPVPRDRALHDRAELRELALAFAKDDAAHGEYRSALRWLQTVEWLDGALDPDLARLRDRWSGAAAEAAT